MWSVNALRTYCSRCYCCICCYVMIMWWYLCRHLDSNVTVDHLLGFNNTGNVCKYFSSTSVMLLSHITASLCILLDFCSCCFTRYFLFNWNMLIKNMLDNICNAKTLVQNWKNWGGCLWFLSQELLLYVVGLFCRDCINFFIALCNVCLCYVMIGVWPSEEVLTYYCLRNLHDFRYLLQMLHIA